MVFQFLKYGIVSVAGYAFQFIGTYLFTEIVGLKANLSYFITITLAYLVLYSLHAGFIFSTKMTPHNFKRYVIYVVVFWFLNNVLFNYIFFIFALHYFVNITINIVVFAPIRFFVSRKWVFADIYKS